MKQSNVRPDALALCMPPEPRFKFAMDAIREGYHLLLEKPPCLTTDECDLLIETAHELDVTIFASWHSKFGAMVKNAAEWLQKNGCDYFEVNWEEDWEKWHPGQKWISRKGGLGVLDPGINALSILCSLFDQKPTSQNVEFLRPANWETPIAAKFNLSFFPNINGGVNLQWQSTLAEKWKSFLFLERIEWFCLMEEIHCTSTTSKSNLLAKLRLNIVHCIDISPCLLLLKSQTSTPDPYNVSKSFFKKRLGEALEQ